MFYFKKKKRLLSPRETPVDMMQFVTASASNLVNPEEASLLGVFQQMIDLGLDTDAHPPIFGFTKYELPADSPTL